MRWMGWATGLVLAAGAAQADIETDPGNAAEGATLYQAHCAVCHGADANGKGPLAPALLVQPADLTTITKRHDGVFPVGRVTARIDGRDPLVSHGSDMPIYGQFFEGRDVALKTDAGQPVITSQPVADLMAWLRTIQK